MEPTEHLDSQLAALRSIISASAMPIPLPPPTPPAAAPVPAPPASTSAGGLTYDAFWSAHGSATASYRSLLAGQPRATPPPLQAHASAPAILAANGSAKAHDVAARGANG